MEGLMNAPLETRKAQEQNETPKRNNGMPLEESGTPASAAASLEGSAAERAKSNELSLREDFSMDARNVEATPTAEDMRFSFMADRISYKGKSKPQGQELGAIRQRLDKVADADLTQLESLIADGYTIMPAICEGGTRKENWQTQQLIFLDFDNKEEELDQLGCGILKPEDALRRALGAGLNPLFLYFTHSSSAEPYLPKYRMVFGLGKPSESLPYIKVIGEALLALFPEADRSCTRPTQMFLSPGREVWSCWQAAEKLTMLDEAIERGILQLPQPKAPTKPHFNRSPELQNALMAFDLLAQANSDTGEDRGYGEPFSSCPICGHQDCFVVYENAGEPDSFYCFGANGSVGGTAIDYFMHADDMDEREAIARVLGDSSSLLTSPIPSSKLSSFANAMLEGGINDKDLSRLFAKTYRTQLRYAPQRKSYVRYDGTKWVPDPDGKYASLLCKDFIDHLANECRAIDSKSGLVQVMKQIERYFEHPKRSSLLKDAEAELLADESEFDRNKMLLNTENGTIDLEAGEFREHRPEDMLTKMAPVKFDPEARCERWSEFVLEAMLGDEETARYLQKAVGMSLACDTSNEKMHILGFETRSGKGVFTGTIETMLGTGDEGYVCNAQGDALERRKRGDSTSARGNVAIMENARFVFVHEPPLGMVLDAAIVKQLTGNDMITARRLYQDERSFKPTANIFMATNHMPSLDDRTVATSGRLVVIPFDNHHSEEDQDKGLKRELSSPKNLSGVLNWSLEGLKLYREEGLEPTERIKEATARAASNGVVGRFVDSYIEEFPGSKVQVKELHDAFLQAEGASLYAPINASQFRDELMLCGINVKKKGYIDGTECRNVIEGFRLRPLG